MPTRIVIPNTGASSCHGKATKSSDTLDTYQYSQNDNRVDSSTGKTTYHSGHIYNFEGRTCPSTLNISNYQDNGIDNGVDNSTGKTIQQTGVTWENRAEGSSQVFHNMQDYHDNRVDNRVDNSVGKTIAINHVCKFGLLVLGISITIIYI